MDALLGSLLSSGGESAGSACDTFSDQLSCVYTVFLLAVFTFLTTTKSFVGNRVSCWCPSHFTSSHEAYTNQVGADDTHVMYRPYQSCHLRSVMSVHAQGK